ncbi:16325_t:CDS:10, partial [Entrophospora sp. SA101]
MFGKKKKPRQPLEPTNSTPSHSQLRPAINSPTCSQYPPQQNYPQYPPQRTQSPEAPQNHQDNSIIRQHKRNQSSSDYCSSNTTSFSDSASSTRYSSESSFRSSGAFSPSEIQAWAGNYYKDAFSKQDSSRPPDEEVEELFFELLNKRDLKNLPESQRKQMLAIPTDKKWVLIKNDKLQEGANKISSGSASSLSHDKNAPEYYLKKIMDGTITVKIMNSLSVSLRTLPITWVRSFIDAKGLEVLTNYLNSITRKPVKREVDLLMEYEIIKCLKLLLNNRALSHPTCIYSITFSLVSSQLNTRRLVAEVLSFFCYCEIPTGHNLVLGGFDQLMQFQNEHYRFDAWMRILENTIDGRGKLGSLVNASDEYKKGGIGVDNSLMEYSLSNLILVNSIIGVCDDVEVRLVLRNQLHACGLTRIIDKMKSFNHELINRQITKFENERTRAYDYFLSALQHILLIRDDGESRTRYFQFIDTLITQIVLDRRGLDQDWGHNVSITVSQMLSKLTDQDKLQTALEEAKEAKSVAEKALREKQELQSEYNSQGDGTVVKLKNKIDSLEELLRISRHTIQTLQTKLADLESSYIEKLSEQKVQLREFENMLKEQQRNEADPDALNRQEMIKKLERMQEIAKTEAKLEGQKVWTPPLFGETRMPDANNYRYNVEPFYSGGSYQMPSTSLDTILGSHDSQSSNYDAQPFISSSPTQTSTPNQYGYSQQQKNLQFSQINNSNNISPGGFKIPDSSPIQMHNNFIKELEELYQNKQGSEIIQTSVDDNKVGFKQNSMDNLNNGTLENQSVLFSKSEKTSSQPLPTVDNKHDIQYRLSQSSKTSSSIPQSPIKTSDKII